jgi:hypothetical protein
VLLFKVFKRLVLRLKLGSESTGKSDQLEQTSMTRHSVAVKKSGLFFDIEEFKNTCNASAFSQILGLCVGILAHL